MMKAQKNLGKPSVGSDDVVVEPRSTTGETRAASSGRAEHEAFKEKVKSKPGWQSEPTLVDPRTGKTVKPDALSPSGKPVELKPDTPTGRKAGRYQLKKYERAAGKKGRVVYYEPKPQPKPTAPPKPQTEPPTQPELEPKP